MNPSQNGRVSVHATCVIPGDAAVPFGSNVDSAVLLFGGSGSGKSDVALRLIAMGARLLADDRSELFTDSGRLFAAAPNRLDGHMEVRGIGIVKLRASGPAPVLFAVNLSNERESRLPAAEFYAPKGLTVNSPPRLFRLNGYDASTPAKIAAAAAALYSQSLLPPDGTFF